MRATTERVTNASINPITKTSCVYTFMHASCTCELTREEDDETYDVKQTVSCFRFCSSFALSFLCSLGITQKKRQDHDLINSASSLCLLRCRNMCSASELDECTTNLFTSSNQHMADRDETRTQKIHDTSKVTACVCVIVESIAIAKCLTTCELSYSYEEGR